MNTAERIVTTLSKVIWPMQQMSILSMLIQTRKVGNFPQQAYFLTGAEFHFPLFLHRYLQRNRDQIADGTAGLSDIEIFPLERKAPLEHTRIPIGRERKGNFNRFRNVLDRQRTDSFITSNRLFNLGGFIRDAWILVRIQVLLFGPQVMVSKPDSGVHRFCINAGADRAARQIIRSELNDGLQAAERTAYGPKRPFNTEPHLC